MSVPLRGIFDMEHDLAFHVLHVRTLVSNFGEFVSLRGCARPFATERPETNSKCAARASGGKENALRCTERALLDLACEAPTIVG